MGEQLNQTLSELLNLASSRLSADLNAASLRAGATVLCYRTVEVTVILIADKQRSKLLPHRVVARAPLKSWKPLLAIWDGLIKFQVTIYVTTADLQTVTTALTP